MVLFITHAMMNSVENEYVNICVYILLGGGGDGDKVVLDDVREGCVGALYNEEFSANWITIVND